MKNIKKPFKTQELDLKITSLAFGGRGVARHSGFVIFVEGAVPGDRVRAIVTRARRSYAEARVKELLNSSPERVEPACRHFGDCGGCAWQTLTYEAQLRYKHQQVNECLLHIGGLAGFEIDPPLGAEPLWRYRNKVELSFAEDENNGLVLGFHKPGQWQRVLDITDCLLHSQVTNQIRNHVRRFARESGASAYDQKRRTGFWRHLVLREAAGTGEVMVNVVTAPGEFPKVQLFTAELMAAYPEIKSLVWSINDSKASVAMGFPFEVLAGREYIIEEICGLKLKVSPSSFLQTNTNMAEKLYKKTLKYAALEGGELVFDLYSGIGSIALLFARCCRQVLGVEIVAEASHLATENARLNSISNASFRAGKVRNVLKQILAHGLALGDDCSGPDIVILDPPRAGASKKEIERILELKAPRLLYVSCNASTLAANAAQLVAGGYRLTRIGAVDMFPHTPHIEVVARFDRS